MNSWRKLSGRCARSASPSSRSRTPPFPFPCPIPLFPLPLPLPVFSPFSVFSLLDSSPPRRRVPRRGRGPALDEEPLRDGPRVAVAKRVWGLDGQGPPSPEAEREEAPPAPRPRGLLDDDDGAPAGADIDDLESARRRERPRPAQVGPRREDRLEEAEGSIQLGAGGRRVRGRSRFPAGRRQILRFLRSCLAGQGEKRDDDPGISHPPPPGHRRRLPPRRSAWGPGLPEPPSRAGASSPAPPRGRTGARRSREGGRARG